MKHYLITAVLLLISFFSLINSAKAGTLNISENPTIYRGDSVTLDLTLDSKNESINAGEFYLTLPNNFEVKSINNASSIFTLWVESPSIKDNTIGIRGGIPYPGFKGEKGLVAKIVVKAIKAGKGSIILGSKSQLLLNDGFGTQTELLVSKEELEVNEAPNSYIPKTHETKDTTPPYDLELRLSKTDTEFDGKWFASFQALDKESGIKEYQVAEIPINQDEPIEDDWQTAKSPYVLKNQNKNIKIYVKAIDNAGNFIIRSKTLKAGFNFLKPAFIIVVIILVLLLFFWKRKKNKNDTKLKSNKS